LKGGGTWMNSGSRPSVLLALVGSGTVVGFTATLTDKIVPHLIGVDIGCGVSAWNLGKGKLKADKLDKFIRKHVPSGYAVSKEKVDKEECETAFEALPETCTEKPCVGYGPVALPKTPWMKVPWHIKKPQTYWRPSMIR